MPEGFLAAIDRCVFLVAEESGAAVGFGFMTPAESGFALAQVTMRKQLVPR